MKPYWKLEYMPRYIASQDQYLVIQHRNGVKEHKSGYVVRGDVSPVPYWVEP